MLIHSPAAVWLVSGVCPRPVFTSTVPGFCFSGVYAPIPIFLASLMACCRCSSVHRDQGVATVQSKVYAWSCWQMGKLNWAVKSVLDRGSVVGVVSSSIPEIMPTLQIGGNPVVLPGPSLNFSGGLYLACTFTITFFCVLFNHYGRVIPEILKCSRFVAQS